MRDKKICIVEDKADLRDGMNLMIQYTEGFELVGSFANCEDAVEKIPDLMPHAVLMDINLPGASGIECVSLLKSKYCDMLFLMCTAYEDNEKIFDSLRAGASGYILKTEGPQGIMAALTELFEGGSPMSSTIARKVVASFVKLGEENKFIELLSDREREVLDKLATGLIGKEVADVLNISSGTVRKHVQNIYKKLHVNSRVEAVNLYLKR